jgi:methyl-accepting chemotaxis protein
MYYLLLAVILVLNSMSIVLLRAYVFIAPVVSTLIALIAVGLLRFFQKRDREIIDQVIEEYSRGNFLASNNKNLYLSSSKEQFKKISALQKTMKDWLYNILESDIALTNYANRLKDNASMALEQMASIGQQIDQIQSNSNDISKSSMENAAVSQEMQSSNDQMASFSHEYMSITETSLVNIKDGKETIVNALTGIDDIEHKMNESVKRVSELEDLMVAIKDMTEGISSISDQTNLLALNASIESARAGEAGRGFAVVANEVTKLADESATLAEKIRSEISSVDQSIQSVVKEIDESVESIKRIKNSNEMAVDQLTTIVQSAEGMLEFIKKIALSINEQLKASEVLASNVESLAETASSSEEATRIAVDKIEDHKTHTHENATLSKALSGVSDRMSSFVNKFDEAINYELFKTGEILADTMKTEKNFEPVLGSIF